MRNSAFISLAAALIGAFLLSGCDVTTPSQVKTGKIELRRGTVTQSLDARNISHAQVRSLAEDYKTSGEGPLRLTIAYPKGDPKTQVELEKQGRAYKDAFARNGVHDVYVDYVGVDGPQYAGMAVVSYNALTANAPAGCGRIPGYDGTDTLMSMEDYDIGCETKSVLSQMVADPKDLLGRGGTAPSPARRHGAATEPYTAGTPNEKFDDAFMASDVGQ